MTGSPNNNPKPLRKTVRSLCINRTGSIDGRMNINAQKFPPIVTIVQDMTADLNLSYENALSFRLPSVDENIQQINLHRKPSGTPPYEGQGPGDPCRTKTVQANLKLALEIENANKVMVLQGGRFLSNSVPDIQGIPSTAGAYKDWPEIIFCKSGQARIGQATLFRTGQSL